MKFKVSIILPFYNVEKYIGRCVDSLLKQSLNSLQFIFIDDCSQDNSRKILEGILAKQEYTHLCVEIITHDKNKGLAAARNSGMDNALGEYIYHCDSDDWLNTDALNKMYNHARSNNADIIWTDFFYSRADKEILKRENGIDDSLHCVKRMLSEQMHGAVWNKLYKRDFVLRTNIRSPEGRDMWEDLYLNVHLFSLADRVSYLGESFYHYNQSNMNSMVQEINEKKQIVILENSKEIIAFLHKNFNQNLSDYIDLFKLASKQTLLFSTEMVKIKRWSEIFPEVNSKIMLMSQLPLHLRIVGYLSFKEYWCLIKLYIWIKRIVKQFR